jgi:hypothetical protein
MNSPEWRVTHPYRTLTDFLISSKLTIDADIEEEQLRYPVKGREIPATILFCDMLSFSSRTAGLNSTETLIFINRFLSWLSHESLRRNNGIIDKYIGDEVMIVFSEEFGSKDSFLDALKTAREIAEHDPSNYCPRIGIAQGIVTVGFTGTAMKYDCTAYGSAVNLAKRCATIQSKESLYSSIFFPAALWHGYDLDQILASDPFYGHGQTPMWKLVVPRWVDLKNIGEVQIMEIAKTMMDIAPISPTQRAQQTATDLMELKQYKPRFEKPGEAQVVI